MALDTISGLENSLFDEFLGNRGSIRYNEAPTVEYPEYTQNVIFGTALLPRVYGKDLTAFEVASSGKVAITLDDVHSLDMSRDSSNSNVTLSTLCNDSFEISVNSNLITIDGVTDDMSLFAKNTLNLDIGSDINVTTASNIDVSASNSLSMVIGSNIDLAATSGSYNLAVNDSNMFVSMDSITNNVHAHAQNNYKSTACNDTLVETKNDLRLFATDGTNNQYIDMKNSVNDFSLGTTGSFTFNVDNKPLLTIDNSNVNISGHLNVTGVIQRENLKETNMLIEDKEIQLATSSNFLDSDLQDYQYDGATNDNAGIVVHGIPQNIVLPAGMSNTDVAGYYEKSLRWKKNADGVLALGGSNVDVESQWELKGGAFYITNTRVDETGEKISDTSFGFRVNHRDELELVKKYIPLGSNMYVTKRIAKFGMSTDML